MIKINLAPLEARRRRAPFKLTLPSFNLGVAFLAVYVVAVGLLGVYVFGLLASKAKLTAEIERGTRELDSLKVTLGQAANVKVQLAELRRRVELIEELTKGQGRPIVLLDAFADVIPRDLWITGMEQKDSVLKLSGNAFSTTAVSDFMANLKSSGKFKDVDIVISRQALDKTPSLVTFEVTCKFES